LSAVVTTFVPCAIAEKCIQKYKRKEKSYCHILKSNEDGSAPYNDKCPFRKEKP
jgi:hypothetical protein